LDELKPHGTCDFVKDFAIRYPTDLFLALLGLPVSDGQEFLEWSETLFSGMLSGDVSGANAAKTKILQYFERALDERRAEPGDPETDMVTRLLQAKIDGEPLTQDEILRILLTLMLAGLDTTRSALGYIFAHLALNDDDRQELV